MSGHTKWVRVRRKTVDSTAYGNIHWRKTLHCSHEGDFEFFTAHPCPACMGQLATNQCAYCGKCKKCIADGVYL